MSTERMTGSIGRSTVALAALVVVLRLASTALAATLPGVSVQPVLWLDAGAGVTASGNQVSNWADQSIGGAGGHDAVQAVGSRQPTLVSGAVNGEPAIRFTPGSLPDSDWMEIADHDDLDIGQGAGIGFTAFIVFSAPDFVGQRHVLEKRQGADDWGFWLLDGNLRWRTENTANLDTPAPSADAFHIWTSDLDQTGASSGTKRSWIDGVMGNTSPQDYTTKEGTNAAPMYIGRHGAAGLEDLFTFSGDLAEVIFFDSALSKADRDAATVYLGTKYGVTVAAPVDMPGISVQPVLWLDAGNGVTESGGLVSLWADKSTGGAGGHDAVQFAAARRPTLVSDAVPALSMPAIRFDPAATSGNYDWMQIPHHADLGIGTNAGVGFTGFMVLDPESYATTYFLLDKRQASGIDDWGIWSETLPPADVSYPPGGPVLRWRNGNDEDDQMVVGAPPLDAFFIYTFDLDQPVINNGTKRVWINGVLQDTQAYANPNPANESELNVGKHGSLPDDFTYLGDMAEIILFNSALSDADRDAVTGYLNTKYFGSLSRTLLMLK